MLIKYVLLQFQYSVCLKLSVIETNLLGEILLVWKTSNSTNCEQYVKSVYSFFLNWQPIDWHEAIETREADKSVGPVDWAKPGYDEAVKMMKSFLDKRLNIYASKKNDPTQDALSNLSPWFHFGM